MASLKQRVETLEAATGPSDPPIIVNRIVVPGHLDAPTVRIQADDGQMFFREVTEDEQAFTDRAARAAGWPNHVVRLIAESNNDKHEL